MKKYAFFLPQYHEIPENNEWWGEGFTEWVSVKKAKPLFHNHIQPKHPLNDNYYNLLEKKTMIEQTNLLDKYNIDGLIYYHYYFKGDKLLEKPAENLLKWKDIRQNFFFCWANHSWIRSWNGSKEILKKQEYGSIKDWEEHFQYLLPFFKDDRYEKRNNKPLFMIFIADFSEKVEMFEYFNKRCIENGFDGIFLIESTNVMIDNPSNLNNTNYEYKIFYREPSVCFNLYNKKIKYSPSRIVHKIKKMVALKFDRVNYVRRYKGDKILREGIKRYDKNNNVIHGLFFEWDNTPRHGKRGYVISSISRKKFNEYMNIIKDEEYLFINAWNEWAEGMILEGYKESGYKYLEWLNEWR